MVFLNEVRSREERVACVTMLESGSLLGCKLGGTAMIRPKMML